MKKVLLLLSLLLSTSTVFALTYKYSLSLKAGQIELKAGKASLSWDNAAWHGIPARHTTLSMRLTGAAARLYVLADTIQSWNTPSGQSLFYSKLVNEGRKHNLETAQFEHNNGHFTVKMEAWNRTSGTLVESGTVTMDKRIYDMLSMLDYAGSILKQHIAGRLKEGQVLMTLPMVNGVLVVDQYLIFEQYTELEIQNGVRTECIQISVRDRKYGPERETMKVFVSRDSACLPLCLQLTLSDRISIRALMVK